MKLNKTKKSPLESSLGNKKAAPSWMTKGSEKIDKVMQRNRAEQMTQFAPTFWVADGEVKQVRFLSTEPIAQIFEYSLMVKGKYRSFTAPATGQPDPFAEKGLTPSIRIVYEVLDVTGYIDKQTKKRVKNVRRFWKLSGKLYENIQRIAKKKGGLTKFNIEVSRAGTGPTTTYTLIPEESTPMPKPDKPTALAADFEKYFAPLSTERLRQLASNVGGREDADDDDDDDEDEE